jgi:hypothetical protein
MPVSFGRATEILVVAQRNPNDVAFTPQMLEGMWLRTFPDAEVTRLDDAGHYLQEDAR